MEKPVLGGDEDFSLPTHRIKFEFRSCSARQKALMMHKIEVVGHLSAQEGLVGVRTFSPRESSWASVHTGCTRADQQRCQLPC